MVTDGALDYGMLLYVFVMFIYGGEIRMLSCLRKPCL